MRRIFLTLMAFAASTAAYAQTAAPPPPAEGSGEPISMLMFLTLGLALAVGVFAMMRFMRKRSNRDAVNRTLNPAHPDNQTEPTARR